MMNSNGMPPLPPLGEYSFDLDPSTSTVSSVNANEGILAVVAAKQGQKRTNSSLINHGISEDDGSQSSKEAFYFDLIDKAVAEKRIDAKKASRLRVCLNSDDVIQALLREQIPDRKRYRSRGSYKCRVCEVPLKGHDCPYCHVCLTPETKLLKGEHECMNCIQCYEGGKRKKKLVQCLKEKCSCIGM